MMSANDLSGVFCFCKSLVGLIQDITFTTSPDGNYLSGNISSEKAGDGKLLSPPHSLLHFISI